MEKSSALELIESYDLPDEGKGYLRDCVRCGPSRSVMTGGTRSVVGAHYSPKLQETRQFESRGSEAAVMIMMDADPSVLAYYSQIRRVEIPSTNKAGRSYVQKYTPDLLILRKEQAQILEVKTSDQLTRLVEEHPHQWQAISEDEAAFLPPQTFFRNLGIKFKVINSSLLPWILVSNTQLLLRTIANIDPPTDSFRRRCDSALSENAWITLGDLQKELGVSRLDDILYLIAEGAIFSAPLKQRLCSQDAILSKSFEVLDEVLHAQVLPRSPVIQDYQSPTLEEAGQAVERMKLAHSGKCRQARRMQEKIRKGAEEGKGAFESLLPKISKRGNRTKRLADAQEQRLMAHQKDNLLTGAIETTAEAYYDYKGKVQDECHQFPPVSIATYYRYAAQLDRRKIQANLHGRKAANIVSVTVRPEVTAPLATRAFQRALVDHTLAKQLLVIAMNKHCAVVRRPWITSLTDEYSGASLAQWLSFNDPSREAICMLIRMCILRHGRVPEAIHSDRGADFKSIHVQALMAFLGVTRQFSPAASPKFNSGAESYFARQQSGLIKKLPGNVVERNRRKSDNIHSPGFKAIFDPVQFYDLLLAYCDEYNNGVHGACSAHPNYFLSESLRLISSSGQKATLSDDVYLATCVPIDAKWGARERRSLYIDGRHFYSPALSPDTKKKDLAIRMDPWNCNVIYVQKKGVWHTALCRDAITSFEGADISRQLGESLRVLGCRKHRDLLKDGQRVRISKLIGDAISTAKDANEKNSERRTDRSVVSDRAKLERAFSRVATHKKDSVDVDWD